MLLFLGLVASHSCSSEIVPFMNERDYGRATRPFSSGSKLWQEPELGGGGGQRPHAKQHVPLGSRAERQEWMARKLFIMFVLPFRHFYCSGCYHQLSVLVNSGFKQLCNCIKLVKGSTATEPQDNTYAPISVRILLWLLIIRLQWLQRILSWRPWVPHFPSWVFLLLLQDL